MNTEGATKSAIELPNFITLLHDRFATSGWADFLHYWQNTVFSLLMTLGLALVFYSGTRRPKLIPSGLQNFLEWIVEGLQSLIY